MTFAKPVLGSLAALLVQLLLPEIASGQSQERASEPNFEACRVIANDDLRLRCLKDLLPKADTAPPSVRDSWQFIRTPNPTNGVDAFAISRTADTTRSDPDFAGLLIRCRKGQDLEVALALVRPFPPREKKSVVLNWGASDVRFEAISTGTALTLPADAAILARETWLRAKEITATIRDSGVEIRGVIPLDGLAAGMAQLSANCPS